MSDGPSRSAFLVDLLATFAPNPVYTADWGTDTDVTIVSNPVHGSWGGGAKRVDYAAALKTDEADRTVYFWESVNQRIADEPAVDPEQSGKRPSAPKGSSVGPGSVSWEWGYGTLRGLIEEVAARHGFTVRVVLTRDSASW